MGDYDSVKTEQKERNLEKREQIFIFQTKEKNYELNLDQM